MSILEKEREVDAETLRRYMPPDTGSGLPVLMRDGTKSSGEFSERELLYKVLFDMKKDMNDLKMLVGDIIQNSDNPDWKERRTQILSRLSSSAQEDSHTDGTHSISTSDPNVTIQHSLPGSTPPIQNHEEVEEPLTLEDQQKEIITKALKKYKGKRKLAAKELGISERTLYRKMVDYNIQAR